MRPESAGPMETTNDTPTAAPSPTGGSAPKSWRWMAIGAASLALMTAGLGIGVAQAQTDGGDTTTTTEAPGATDGDAPERPTDEEIEAFQACMADNGVDLPDERPARGERPERTEEEEAAFEAALEACDELKPEGFGHHGPGGRGGPGCDDAAEGDEATEPGAEAEDTAATTGS